MPAPKKSPKLLAGRLACLFRGHAWDTGRLFGYTLAACSRCDAIVAVQFVDVPTADTRLEVGRPGPVGDRAAGRDIVALLRARRTHDDDAAAGARKRLTARPGTTVDAFAEYVEQRQNFAADREWPLFSIQETALFESFVEMGSDVCALREGLQP